MLRAQGCTTGRWQHKVKQRCWHAVNFTQHMQQCKLCPGRRCRLQLLHLNSRRYQMPCAELLLSTQMCSGSMRRRSTLLVVSIAYASCCSQVLCSQCTSRRSSFLEPGVTMLPVVLKGGPNRALKFGSGSPGISNTCKAHPCSSCHAVTWIEAT